MPEKTKEAKDLKEKKKTTTKAKSTSKAKTTTTAKKKTTSKKTTSKKATAKKTTAKKSTKKAKPAVEIVEYYDLPYRYNETIVKILYQTPNTLFVYWDISDEDRANYVEKYGENFFNNTRPVLIVHNKTLGYSFEVPINDFANSWYLHINDSKCDYTVELGRKPNSVQKNNEPDYVYISNSNDIESPNDHVLFNTNENNTIKFRNVKNNLEHSVTLYDIVKHLPALKGSTSIPYISKELFKQLYSGIYQNEDISFFDRISNPSSGEFSEKF